MYSNIASTLPLRCGALRAVVRDLALTARPPQRPGSPLHNFAKAHQANRPASVGDPLGLIRKSTTAGPLVITAPAKLEKNALYYCY